MWFYIVPGMIGVLASAPFVMLWFFPKLLIYAFIYLVVLAGILFWSLWEPGRLAKAWWPWLTLFLFWLSCLIFFLFIEGDYYTFIFSFFIALITAWYLYGWLIGNSQLVEINRGAGLVATIILVNFSIFFFSISVNSLLVYLNYSYWLLFGLYSLIILLLSLAVGWSAGWRLKEYWPYLFTLLIIQLQAFVVLNWLPVSSYIIAWFLSLLFFIVFLLSRFDTGLTISRRTLLYYLLSLGASSLFILLTIRWF